MIQYVFDTFRLRCRTADDDNSSGSAAAAPAAAAHSHTRTLTHTHSHTECKKNAKKMTEEAVATSLEFASENFAKRAKRPKKE